ncbi:MAG: BatA domain-containing protein [Verrucomicrobiales bacterium]
MSLTFANAGLAALLLLGAVPVLIHLFARSRPPAFAFPSVAFLRRVARRTARVKRPQEWLLLAIRTLLALALIFAFLRPLFFSQQRLSGLFQQKNVVLVIDASASMACSEGGRTRFAAACAEASEILRGISSGDAANIVWLDSAPDAALPEMGANLGFLQDALRRAKVTTEAGDPEAAVRAALALLENRPGKKEICLVSDFQATDWGDAPLEIPDGVDLIQVRIGDAVPPPNLAVTNLYWDPAEPMAGEEVTIYAEVANFSAEPKGTGVFLEAGEGRRSQDAQAQPWAKAAVAFSHRFPAPGDFPVSVSLSEDAFPADDARHAVVPVRGGLRVAVESGAPDAAAVKRALAALGWAQAADIAGAADLASGGFDAAYLNASGAGADLAALEPAASDGAMVIVAGPGAGDQREQIGAGSEPLRLRLMAPNAEPFALFSAGGAGDPAGGLFRGRARLSAGSLPAGSEIWIEFLDGVPALASARTGKGSVLRWNLPLDPESSNFAARPEFVPLLGEILLSGRQAAPPPPPAEPGQPLVRKLGDADIAASITLTGPRGEDVAAAERRSAAEGAQLASADPVADPGIYTWLNKSEPLGYTAVNFPPSESDLRPAADGIASAAGSGTSPGVQVAAWRAGPPTPRRREALAVAARDRRPARRRRSRRPALVRPPLARRDRLIPADPLS